MARDFARGHAILKEMLRSPWMFFAVLLCLYGFSVKERAANQFSRFNLVRSIVHEGTFAVDNYRHNTMDLAVANGHYYSNKGPGTSFLGVPVYALNVAWQKLLGKDPAHWARWNFWFVELVSTNLPAAWLVFMMMRLLLLWEPHRPEAAWRTAFAYGIGTSAFPFALTMWGHQTATAFAFAGFYFLEWSQRERFRRNAAWAGFCYAFAVSCDYSVLLLLPAFGAYFAATYPKTIRWLALRLFLLGSLAPALGLLFYHWRCFGNPFTMPQTVQIEDLPYDPAHFRFAGQWDLPSPRIFGKLLFGKERGLFLFSPVLLLALVGWRKMWRQNPWRWMLSVLPLLLFTAAFSGYVGWFGGGSSGPRYLLPSLPFLALGMAWVRWKKPEKLLLAVSVINACAVICVTVLAAGDQFVLRDGIYPFLWTDVYYAYDFIVLIFGCLALYLIGSIVNWKSWQPPRAVPQN